MLLVEWKLAPQELLSVFEQKTPSCLQRLVTSEFHVEFQWIFMQDVPLYFLCPTFFFFFVFLNISKEIGSLVDDQA